MNAKFGAMLSGTQEKGPGVQGPFEQWLFITYRPPGCVALRLFVPGPTLPWLEGFAAGDLVDFMLAPVVMDEGCLTCFFDFASAARGEPMSPAMASAPISSLVFIMRMSSLG
jgi:hypothetical protein